MPEIGTTLREARMRARIDVSEIEEQTKIRAKYLRALENEEWSLLPGPTYAKSFLRAYAQALGLDGRALVEEYKARFEHPGEVDRAEAVHQPLPYNPRRRHPARHPVPAGGLSRGYVVAGAIALVVVVLALVGIVAGSSSKNAGTHATRTSVRRPARSLTGIAGRSSARAGAATGVASATAGRRLVTLSLRPTARIWVCLIGDGGRKLIPGSILLPEEGRPLTFRARRFQLNLGDDHVRLTVDGHPQAVPESAQAIGYTITAAGIRPLAQGSLPTCA